MHDFERRATKSKKNLYLYALNGMHQRNMLKIRRNILIYTILALVAIGIAAVAWLWASERRPAFSVNEGQNARLYVYPNMTLDDVCRALEQAQFTADAAPFKRYMRRKQYDGRIKVGCYRIADGMTNRTLAQHLIFGMQEPIRLKFNNIRLKSELAARLDKQLLLDSATIAQCLDSAAFLSAYGVTPATALTLFIPNTYEVYWDMTASQLFGRMKREYDHFWNDERRAQAAATRLTPTEVMILASIVDEETNVAADKPIIAGLYINRLRRGIPLQACPTARYALGDFTITRVLDEHTKIDSPYNTYKHRGLPPGPIRVASIAAIDAVLNYTHSNYIYMCASDKMDGSHNFAATLAEHNRNAQKYHRAYRQWRRNNSSK